MEDATKVCGWHSKHAKANTLVAEVLGEGAFRPRKLRCVSNGREAWIRFLEFSQVSRARADGFQLTHTVPFRSFLWGLPGFAAFH